MEAKPPDAMTGMRTAELTAAGKIVSVAGGGDTVAALNASGTTDCMTYVSAAGGALHFHFFEVTKM